MYTMKRFIEVNGILYHVKGTQRVATTDIKGGDYWKDKWNVDTILRNGDMYYFCQTVIDAEFT